MILNGLKNNSEWQHQHEVLGPIRLCRHLGHESVSSHFITLKKKNKQMGYCMAVIPFGCHVDLNKIKFFSEAELVMLTPSSRVFDLTGHVLETLPPFSPGPNIPLFVDPFCLQDSGILFPAGQKGKYALMKTVHYIELAHPETVSISLDPGWF